MNDSTKDFLDLENEIIRPTDQGTKRHGPSEKEGKAVVVHSLWEDTKILLLTGFVEIASREDGLTVCKALEALGLHPFMGEHEDHYYITLPIPELI